MDLRSDQAQGSIVLIKSFYWNHPFTKQISIVKASPQAKWNGGEKISVNWSN